LPNIKSAEKRVEIARIRTERNKARKSTVKTAIRKYEAMLTEGNIEGAQAQLKEAAKQIDMAVTKGVLHKNTAARKKSRLSQLLNQAAAEASK
jgi:small subunit ribosomal protein S20